MRSVTGTGIEDCDVLKKSTKQFMKCFWAVNIFPTFDHKYAKVETQ